MSGKTNPTDHGQPKLTVSGYPRPEVTPYPLTALATELSLPVTPAGGTAPADVLLAGVTHSSGDVRPGDLYAALPGARRHGAEFIDAAAGAGAVAVLTDPDGAARAADAGLPALVVPDPRSVLGYVAATVYGDPTRNLPIIGITGTAGKTSTAYLVEGGLLAAGRVSGLLGTVETRLGDLVIDSVRTTPEATDLQALLAVALQRGVSAVVMEVSSHALAMGRVTGTRFAVGGYTNFGLDHLDFHADADEYFAAKALLFDGRCRVEILNYDDPALVPLRKPGTVTYSADGDPSATWRAERIVTKDYGQEFQAIGPDGTSVDAAVALPGRHNVANALLALASLYAIGVDPQVAAAGIAACPGVPGRLERVDAPGPVLGVVDYAHKPDAIVAALAALRESAGAGRVICVIGAGGDRDRGKRPLMGAAAARGADVVIVTDDNPRTEDPAVIRSEVRRGADEASAAGQVLEIAGRRVAIAAAVSRAVPGDVIAILGKGHERGQETNGRVEPFDDRVELAAALRRRFAGDTGVPGGDR